MQKKCKCIICRQFKSGSVEHIIPKALGNDTLVINNVCTQCNSGLGYHVDNYLTNHRLIQIIRQALKLKGQSGKVPNPFKNGIDDKGNRIYVDEKFKPHTVPYIEHIDNRIRIIAETKEQAKEMGLKKLERLGQGENAINKFLEVIDQTPVQAHTPIISYEADVDFSKFFLSALKIAYEYAWLKLGSKFENDITANEIRDILFAATQGNFQKRYSKIRQLPEEICNLIKPLQHLNCHLLTLHRDPGNQLIVNVILFMSPAFSYSVCVSNSASQYTDQLGQECILDIVEIGKDLL